MTTDDALKELISCLTKPNFAEFIFHPEFINEMSKLVKKLKGNETELYYLLTKQLGFVDECGKNVNIADHNEILKHVKTFDCYSLHLVGKNFNIRMLMTFVENDRPLFLCVFNEKSGKRSTNYTEPVERAKARLQQYGG